MKFDRNVNERLKKTIREITNTMTRFVEIKDPYTAGHQARVAELSLEIAKNLGFYPNRLEGLHIAATLHDIGKVFVPAEILAKPGKLLPLEFELIKTHSKQGADILSSIEFPFPITDFIEQHHEKLDGSGYPNNLTSDEITLEAKIIAVADIVEAMSQHRPYRPALGIEKALATIKEMAPIKLDQKIVDTCIELFNDGFSFSK